MEVSFAYFTPLIVFFLVFVVMYALLARTKLLGGNPFVHLFTSFLISTIFIASPALTDVTRLSLPWVALFVIILLCILIAVASVGNLDKILGNPKFAMMAVIFIIIIFLVSAINVFGPIIKPYLPTATSEAGGVAELLQVKHLLFSPAVAGMLVLLAVAAIASWIVTKKK